MRKSVISILVIAALVGTGIAAACQPKPAPPAPAPVPAPTATSTPTTSTETYTLNFEFVGWQHPIDDNIFKEGGLWQRMVSQRSGGRLKLNIIHPYDAMDALPAIQDGRMDLGHVAFAYLSGTYPLYNWAEIPGLFSLGAVESQKEEAWVNADPRLHKIWDKTLREQGTVFLSQQQYAPANVLFTDQELTSLASLKGKKIRTPGHIGGLTLEALGAKPVQVVWGEITSSQLTGITDAVLITLPDGLWWVGLDFVKYIIPIPAGPGWTAFTVMNAKKFDSLPPDLQQVLKDVGRDLIRITSSMSLVGWLIPGKEGAEKLGIKILEWPSGEVEKAKPLLKPVEDEWLKIAGPYGPEVLSIVKEDLAKYREMPQYPK
ncbi:MAG: hypothetical protein HY530_01465 [Chloroflexi bacterium]|nr:hypothetical protein [Chloroflexota bacterium]